MKGRVVGRVVCFLLLLILLALLAVAGGQPASAQGTCSDGVCDPDENARTCPQDCGILVVDEDFEDGEVQGWHYDPSQWQIIDDDGSLVWSNLETAYAFTGDNAWSDIVWFVRVRRMTHNANLYFRIEEANSYGLLLEADRVVLWTERSGAPEELAWGSVDLGTDWHGYRIEAIGPQITVTVDSDVVLTFSDGPEASLHGAIGLEAFCQTRTLADSVRFDDIQLYSTQPQCYDGIKNGDETGIDCGGSCPLQDCCANRAWDVDLDEGGVDCGGPCTLECQPADQLDRWTQTNGPWLEYIRRIRFDPDDAETLIISSNTGSGVIKSTDAGQTWHELSDGLSPMNVFGLAMDPADKDVLYAGTANGRLFTTDDGGAWWDLLWEYTEVDDALWSVEVDPTDGDRLFVGMGDYTGCDGRIYRSEDRGVTWQKVLDVDPTDDNDAGFISHIAFDPTTPLTMYATTGIGDWCGGGGAGSPDAVSYGIWKSVDGGATWFEVNNGLDDLTVSHLVIDPGDPQTLYAGVGCVDDDISLPGNVYKSTDGGASWQQLDVSPDQPITRLALHPADPQKVYAGGYSGMFYSEDGGASWDRLDEAFKSASYSFLYDLVFAPGDPDTMYMGTYSGGIIKSIDGGRNWFEINGLRHDGDVLACSYGTALDPTDPDTVYATTIGGAFKTANGGETWQFISPGLHQHLREFAVDPADPQRLYLAGGDNYFYTSADGGGSWQQMDLGAVGGDVPTVAVDPHDPDRVYITVHSDNGIPLYRSTDQGGTWVPVQPLGLDRQGYALAFHPDQPGTVYLGAGWQAPLLFRSDDGGVAWQDVAPDLSLVTVYDLEAWGDWLFAATNGSSVQIGWGGGTQIWEPIGYVHPGNYLSYITRLAIGRGSGELLAFDKSDLTLYHADDPYEPWAWQPVLQLDGPEDDLYDLIYAPDATYAFATTRAGGLWRSSDGGLTWALANAGLPAGVTFRGLAADENTPGQLYLGQAGAPGRLYHSADGGDSWAPLNDDLTFSTVHAFARDPFDPDVAYAGLWGGGTWKTEDGGASWALLPEAPASAAWIAVDPADPQIVYATDRTEPVLWQSADGGQRWWRRFDAGAGYSRLQALAIDPHRPDTVYVSAFAQGGYGIDGSLFRVTRAGYRDITGDLPRVAISLAVSPGEEGVLLASTHIYGLYRSADGGTTWQVVEAGLPRVGFNTMAWEPGSGVLYGGACSGSFPDYMRPPGLPDGDDEPGLYRSADGGQSWEKVLAGPVGKGFAFAPGAVYAATESGLYLSTDGGDTWSEQAGGPPLAFSAVAAGEGTVYAGTLGGGVHTATTNPDHSLSWQGSNGPTAEIHALQLASIPGAPGTLFATSFPGGVFKSTDAGASWHEANFGLPGFTLADPARNGYYALAVNPADPSNLYLGIYGYGVYRSDDGAATWLPANTGLGNRFVYSLLVEADGSHLWAGTNDGIQSLWRSATDTPGRLAWSPAPASPEGGQAISGLTLNPENADQMALVAFPGGVFSSGDGGAHWYERSNNLYAGKLRTHGTGFEDGNYQLARDPVDPRHLVYGTYTAQVYETRDGGLSWSAMDEGLMREGSIYAFEFAPDGSRLYVSQKAGGVLRRAVDPTTPQTRVVAADGVACTAGSHLYGTVGGALAAANPGDTIFVCPGNYFETVTVDQALWLVAWAGPSRTYLQRVAMTADGARLAGFRLSALAVEGAAEVELLGNVVLGEIYLPLVVQGVE